MTINWNFWESPGTIIGSNERQLLERMMSLVAGSFIYTCVERLGGVDLNIFTSRKPTRFRQLTCIWLVKVLWKKKNQCTDWYKNIQYINSISSFLLKIRIKTVHFLRKIKSSIWFTFNRKRMRGGQTLLIGWFFVMR